MSNSNRVRRVDLFLGIVAMLMLCFASTALAGEIPDVLYNDWEYHQKTYPNWVSAEIATDKEGAIVKSLFLPDSPIHSIKDFPIDPDRGCIPLDPPSGWHRAATPAKTLEETLELAKIALIGEVTERASGFERGWPGWMAMIETNEPIKGAVIQHYYAFFPVGQVPTGLGTYCLSDNRFPDITPEVGDSVVLMFENIDNPSDPFVDLGWQNRAIVLRTGSVHACSNFLVSDLNKSMDESEPSGLAEDAEVLLGQVRAWAAHQGGAR